MLANGSYKKGWSAQGSVDLECYMVINIDKAN